MPQTRQQNAEETINGVSMFWEGVRAFTVALLCAIIWLSLAFLVALPGELADGEFAKAIAKFMDREHLLERVFFLMLIVTDVVIDASLGHSRFHRWSGWASIVVGVVYVFVMIVLPLAGADWNADSVIAVFWVGMVCLLFIRWASFFEVKQPDLGPFGSPTPDPVAKTG